MKKLSCAGIFVFLGMVSTASFSENIPSFFNGFTISGKIRAYDFLRNYQAEGFPQQTAFALGGDINILTPDLYFSGLKADADFYTAQSLNLNNGNPALVDRTLGESINVLAQAYLQYDHSGFLVKAGRQIIDTPWINPSDSRMIPNAYEGVFASYHPVKDVTLEALKVFKFKDRIANNFSNINLYNPVAQGEAISKLADVRNDGAVGAGAQYKNKEINSQLWYYQFYDFSKLGYVDGEYDVNGFSQWVPFVGAQALRETADGDNNILRYTGTQVNATAYGVMAGVKNDLAKVSVAYNQILKKDNAFGEGDIISPYTAGYATDPLYTTSMIAGLVEKGQGSALKTSASVFLLDKQLTLTGSYAKYFVTSSNDTQEVDVDAKYSFVGKLKGFSIRDRVGVLYNDPKYSRFIYNRVMLEYAF